MLLQRFQNRLHSVCGATSIAHSRPIHQAPPRDRTCVGHLGRKTEGGRSFTFERRNGMLPPKCIRTFSKDANEPFNFLNTALRNNPIAATFADHITKVATVFSRTKPQPEYGTKVFEHLAPLVASAIFLGATRNRLPHRGTSSRSTPPNTN